MIRVYAYQHFHLKNIYAICTLKKTVFQDPSVQLWWGALSVWVRNLRCETLTHRESRSLLTLL